jgi:transcriptional coactivator p15 (PC4)
MADQEHVVLELRRGENDVLRVTRKTYEGKPFTDVRVYYRADDGELRPTKKGCSIRDRELPQVLTALQRVAEKVAATSGSAADEQPRGAA